MRRMVISSSLFLRRATGVGKWNRRAPLWTLRRFQSGVRGGSGSDYYTTLGVSRSASQDEIKSAYKKLVLKWHPDRNKAPNAEERFKEISQAYSVLGNSEKRQQYDMAGSFGGFRESPEYHTHQTYQRASGSGEQAPFWVREGRRPGMSKSEADDLFRQMFGGGNIDQVFADLERAMQGMRGPAGGMGGDPFTMQNQQIVRDRHGKPYRVTTTFTSNTASGSSRESPPNEDFEMPSMWGGGQGRRRGAARPFFGGGSSFSGIAGNMRGGPSEYADPFGGHQQEQQQPPGGPFEESFGGGGRGGGQSGSGWGQQGPRSFFYQSSVGGARFGPLWIVSLILWMMIFFFMAALCGIALKVLFSPIGVVALFFLLWAML